MRGYNISLCFFLLTFCRLSAFAQEIPSTRRIVIDTFQKISFSVLIQKRAIRPDQNLIYYCYTYSTNRIIAMQGGITGLLLQGVYEVSYEDGKLSEKGSFIAGLKSDKWHFWYKSGLLRRIENWKKGVLDGVYIEYNETGNPLSIGKYSNGKIKGKVRIFKEGNLTETRIYRKGELIKTKNPKVKKKRASKNENSNQ